MKTLVNIITKLFWLIFYLCLFIIISPILKLPFDKIPTTFVVMTGSMKPTIQPGSIAVTFSVNPTSLKVSDIIAFTSPSDVKDVIIHRIDNIISTKPLRFSTKGDANNSVDNWDVVDVGILGKYIFSIPLLGYLSNFIKQPLGFAILVITPALLFIIRQIISIKKTIKEEVDKQVKNQTSKTGNIFPVVFISTFFSLFLLSQTLVHAFYQDTVIISGFFITVADFDTDKIPPITQITTDLYSQTSSSFEIAYTLIEDNPDHIDLCSSYNLENWDCQNRGLDNPIIYSPNQGNGVYCFITQGFDTFGNIENINFPNPPDINPLDVSLYCTNFISQ